MVLPYFGELSFTPCPHPPFLWADKLALWGVGPEGPCCNAAISLNPSPSPSSTVGGWPRPPARFDSFSFYCSAFVGTRIFRTMEGHNTKSVRFFSQTPQVPKQLFFAGGRVRTPSSIKLFFKGEKKGDNKRRNCEFQSLKRVPLCVLNETCSRQCKVARGLSPREDNDELLSPQKTTLDSRFSKSIHSTPMTRKEFSFCRNEFFQFRKLLDDTHTDCFFLATHC